MNTEHYDVAVIGGGPAGMMAAGRAGEVGAKTVLIEKNEELGRKLLITGKGRCNITNKKDGLREMTERFGKNGKFLFSSFYKFGPDDIIIFFESRGVKTKIERGGRVFPVSDRAKDILEALKGYLKETGVEVKNKAKAREIIKKGGHLDGIVLADGRRIIAKSFIICPGGKTYPSTGSTGDGYKWAKKMGHAITKLFPVLVPIIVKEKIVQKLEGLSLKNVEITVYKNGEKIDSGFGEALFTANGLSGPVILDLSRKIGQELSENLRIQIDFKPALDSAVLDKRVQRDFRKENNKMFKNCLNRLLPQKLISVIVELSGIKAEKRVNLVTREERKKLIRLLKNFVLEIKGFGGYDQAVITSGGVSLEEIDPRTMKSKLVDNLYFAGEILDVDGPTGGYNLQVCWSTGYMAGDSAGRLYGIN